jgi:DNA-binding XRE family transcriptional regulator
MDQENNVKRIREAQMLSKAELARLAGISPLTLDRLEKGQDCRLATKRKILLALGLTIEQKHTLFKQ